MLKVTVAEVQRAILKQFGINLGAAHQLRQLRTAILTENALPLTAAAGLGKLPIPGIGTAGSTHSADHVRDRGQLCNCNAGFRGSSTFGNSGVTNGFHGNNAASPAPCARSSATASCARWPSRT